MGNEQETQHVSGDSREQRQYIVYIKKGIRRKKLLEYSYIQINIRRYRTKKINRTKQIKFQKYLKSHSKKHSQLHSKPVVPHFSTCYNTLKAYFLI